MSIRLLHFIPGSYNTCKLLGEILFSTFIPFGILLEIGLLFFKKYSVVWEEMTIYIVFSIMFLLSVLLTEILLVIFTEYYKKKKNTNQNQSRGKNMKWKQFYLKIKSLNIGVKFGFILFIIGVIFILGGTNSFFNLISFYELGLWFTSFSFAIIGLGYAFDSDEKMKQSQIIQFLGILNNIEYTRMMYINDIPGRYDRSTFIWRTLRDVERVKEINKSIIKQRNQWDFVSYIIASIVELFRLVNWQGLPNGEKSQITKILVIISNYERNPDDKRIDAITSQMGRPANETIIDFINRLRTEYNIDIDEE
jgi:hypothetical protein